MYNPYQQNMYSNYPYAAQAQQNFQQQQLPHYEVIKVNGKPGVDAFQMGPNSSVLLLDETADLVWFVQTDGAGYKTPTPFKISPYVEQPPVDVNALLNRVISLENMVLELQNGGQSNESNSSTNAEKRQSRNRNGNQQQSTK